MKTILIACFLWSVSAMARLPGNIDAIYNIDNRELVSEKSSPEIQNFAKSVALIFDSNDLIVENEQSLIFANLLEDVPPVGMNICPDELFADHHAYRSACSGFLVGKDLLASAGHCFENQFACDNQIIAFDVDANSEIGRGFKTQEKNLYRCKEIVGHFHQEGSVQDFAVVKLDRKSDRTPLKIRTSGTIEATDKVFLIGHPLGLPLVYSPPAEISDVSDPIFFQSKINSFRGNSGSPVFNAKTKLVEGILVRGSEDLYSDQEKSCQRYKKYSSSEKNSEDVTRIKSIIPYLKK